MPSFGNITPTNLNPLDAFYSSEKSSLADQAATLANQQAQQNQADAATLRGLAPGLAANDPNATATALTLPNVGGVTAAGGLTNMHADQRAQLGQTLSTTGAISGAILAAPAAQRPALWAQMRPAMIEAGAVNTPVEYPGDDALAAHRTAALGVQQQIATLATVPTTDPFHTPLSAPAGPSVGPGGVIQGGQAQAPAGTSATAPSSVPSVGAFANQLGAAESPQGPGAVNASGYSGQFQFGASRLADPAVGVYTPAPGENVNANTWQGTFHIPGFPNVKTHADFLASPDAQRAVFGIHVADIDRAIGQTPGAAGMNQNGLRAVAHIGGVAGMQRFVSTGGLYNPADNNGTTLMDYYNHFSQGGPRALQASFGHPAGPLPSAPAAAPAAAPSGAGAAPAPGAVSSVPPGAGATPAPAVPAAAAAAPAPAAAAVPAGGGVTQPSAPAPGFDANGQPLPAGTWNASPPAPGTQSLDDVMAGLRSAQGTSAPGATAPVPSPNALLPDASTPVPAPRNQLMPSASAVPPASAGPQAAAPGQPRSSGAPVNGLMPSASAQAPGATQAPSAPVGQILYRGGVPIPASVPGYVATRMPDGSFGMTRLPGAPPKIKSTPVGGMMINTDENTGQEISRFPIPDASRSIAVQVPGGTQLMQSGHPVGPVIPFSGRPEQAAAYKDDLPRAEELTSAANYAQQSMPRLNEMADLTTQLATGGASPVLRAKAAAYLEQIGVAPTTIQKFTGMDSGSAAQLFSKLAISTAGAAAHADVGANNGIQSMTLYQNANPGMNLLPDANKRVTNMMRVSAQQIQDYAQGALQYFGQNEKTFLAGGNYAPLTTFNRGWLAQSNPQIGAAAMGILNGDPFTSWSARITPAEGAQAAALALRVDPNVLVPLKGGGTRPASQILAHPSVAAPQAPPLPGAN